MCYYLAHMRLSATKVSALVQARKTTLSAALRESEVSRTAYYSLARRSHVLPRSIRSLAATLGVAPAELLEPTPALDTAERKVARVRRICAEHPEADFRNVWHALSLLELDPRERLERSLRRGRVGTVL